MNNSVLTDIGHDFTGGENPLPAAANAVRFVHGIRRLGDIEYARISFKIVDVDVFYESVFEDRDFCLDGTGSDTDKIDRGAQDNVWRYYEGNAHSCFDGSADASFVKFSRFVNNLPSAGANLAPDEIVGYEIRLTNTSDDPLYDISFADTATSNLDLVDEGDADCPYGSYDSVPAGATFNNGALPGFASWNVYPMLEPGDSVSVFVCAAVDTSVTLGDQVENTATITYALEDGGIEEPPIDSIALGTVSSQLAGVVYSDPDESGTLTPGDVGLEGVTVKLWDDSTGSQNGVWDSGDTLLRTTVTTSDGAYAFNGFFGDFIVEAINLPLYTSTGDKEAADCLGNGCDVIGRIVLANDEKSLGNDFFDAPPPADLSIVKTVDNSSAAVDSTVTFNLALSNAGPGIANNTQVTDLLPAGFTYVDNSMSGGDSRDDSSAPTLVWSVNSLPIDTTVDLTFRATVNATGNHTNVAQVTASDQADTDSTPANDDGDQSEDDEDNVTVTAITPPSPEADLSLVKTVSNATAAVGSDVTFTLTLSNAGPDDATAISVEDVLPNGFTYIDNSMSGGDSRNEGSAPTLVWTVDSLANGAQEELTFQATVAASGDYQNVAEITASVADDSDSTPGNGDPSEDDQGSVTVTPLEPTVDLELVNTVDTPTAEVGATVTFTIELRNEGPDTATNITVADLLPAGFTYVASSMSGGDARDDSSGSALLWSIDSLASGAAINLTFEATVNASGPYFNVAEVTASDQNDSDSAPNNGDLLEDDHDGISVTLQGFPPGGSASAIPVLGEWMLALLVLFMAGLGIMIHPREGDALR